MIEGRAKTTATAPRRRDIARPNHALRHRAAGPGGAGTALN